MEQTTAIKLGVVGALLLLTVIFQPMSCTRVDGAHEGVLVELYGANRGAQATPLSPGFHWYNSYYEQIETYPNHVVTRAFTASLDEGGDNNEQISVSTKDGLIITFDCAINYRIKPGHAPKIFLNYRKELPELESGIIRTWVRGAYQRSADDYNAVDLYAERNKFETESLTALAAIMDSAGFVVEQLQILNALRLPDNVVTAINNKVQATQIAQTKQQEIQQVRFDSAKVVIEAAGKANALLIGATTQAKANQLLQESLTPMLLQKMYYETWNGVLPNYMMGGNSSSLIQLPTK